MVRRPPALPLPVPLLVLVLILMLLLVVLLLLLLHLPLSAACICRVESFSPATFVDLVMSAFLSEEDKAKASSWNHSYAAADERAGEDSLGNPAGEERFWRWQQQQQQRRQQKDKKH